jgi:hypothetical protein
MRPAWSTSSHTRPTARRIAPALLLSITIAAASPVTGVEPPAAADAQVAANPAVITTWNAHAVATLAGAAPAGAAKLPPEVFLYLSFVHIAMYNAVNGITGEYELYRWHGSPQDGASPEAAAAAAAHRVLHTYFGTLGTIGADLDAKLAASLALIPDGQAKDRGILYGQRAADRIIELREDDGRGATVTVPVATEPGDWMPTPPAMAPFLTPWYGYIDPLAVRSVAAFDPGPPPPIGSRRYLKQFREVRDYGAAVSAVRTPEQEQTARFFADTPVGPMQAALRRLATDEAMDISDSARLFAAAEVSTADALQAVWYAKHKYMWWRPITAIQMADADGDPRTASVPGWAPLITNPPYPEWPSGLCSVIGAVSTVAMRMNGGELDLHIVSPAAGERHYTDARTFRRDAVDARVWSGIHFRTSDRVSIQIGRDVAQKVLGSYFQPAD